jgi:hypothetical protein
MTLPNPKNTGKQTMPEAKSENSIYCPFCYQAERVARVERLKTYCKMMDMLLSEGILCEDSDGEVFRVGGAFSSKSVHQRIQLLRKDLEI